ncbi:putative alkaline shock family protein YloU [Cytobacillus purgationiresistens]|uniref:Alkaline shock family protein YloU n=2 Tax=Cytobacillus purgationiresistens TaxID=863449 RepID=A0ABU0AMB8_9BACI|nr:putative alkaline shock family protein YloU [Cytobacillus purgationiresistens]
MRLLEDSNPETMKVAKYIISSIIESNVKELGMNGVIEPQMHTISLFKKSSDDISIAFHQNQVSVKVKLTVIGYIGLIENLTILQKQIAEEIKLFTGLEAKKIHLYIAKMMVK